STSPNSASSTAFRPNGISAWIIASVTGVVTVPSSNGSAAWPPPIGDCWFFRVCSRTLGMGGVLGTEWKSLAGFTLLYRGTTCFSTTTGTHPRPQLLLLARCWFLLPFSSAGEYSQRDHAWDRADVAGHLLACPYA